MMSSPKEGKKLMEPALGLAQYQSRDQRAAGLPDEGANNQSIALDRRPQAPPAPQTMVGCKHSLSDACAGLSFERRYERSSITCTSTKLFTHSPTRYISGLEPISSGRLRRWQYLVVPLYCLRYCSLDIDLTR